MTESSPEKMQDSPWGDEATIPWPPKDLAASPGGQLSDEDCETIEIAIATAKQAANSHPGNILLHIGIGVGNPRSTLKDVNNPSLKVSPKSSEWQVNPPFLLEAQEKGYYVIALSFNQPDPDHPILHFAQDKGVHIQVPARFPLADRPKDSKTDKIFNELLGLAAQAKRVVVISAVSQMHYPGIIEFTSRAYKRQDRLVSYVLAYEETNMHKVIFVNQKFAPTHKKLPMTLDDLFFPGT